MKIVFNILLFLIFFAVSYFVYMFYVVIPQSRALKKNKKKKYPPEISLLKGYYKINIDKVGVIRILRILNFANALMFASLVMVVYYIDKVYFKLIVLAVLIMPTIWVVYYFVAKYLRHLERKYENV